MASERQPTASVVDMQNTFALDLYRRLATSGPGGNLFFSPYSVFSALAMTAEGATRETADEMGRALRLAPALRRAGAPEHPWDFAPVHAGLAELTARLQAGEGVAPEVSARIDSLRQALAAINDSSQRAIQSKEWMQSLAIENRARETARTLNELLPQVDRYELRVANALWADARYALAPAYVNTLARDYGTGPVHAVDFAHGAEAARRTINDWVAEQTNQRIRDLLASGVLDSQTRLVLTNAIWFKGEWAEIFEASATRQAVFEGAAGTSAEVPLMYRDLAGSGYAAFREGGAAFHTPKEVSIDSPRVPDDPKLYPGAGGFQLVELPYKGGELSMVVLLPRSRDGLAELEKLFDAARLSTWIKALEKRRVDVYLPRFRLEQGRELEEPLRALGVRRAFVDPATGHGAQFDGIATGTDPAQALFLGAVVHKAFLDVNEKGTEAAAATAVTVRVTSVSHANMPFIPTFRADRPFLFLIRDVKSGAILFLGRYAKP